MALWVKLGFTSSVHPIVVSGDYKHRGLRQCVALTSHHSPPSISAEAYSFYIYPISH